MTNLYPQNGYVFDEIGYLGRKDLQKCQNPNYAVSLPLFYKMGKTLLLTGDMVIKTAGQGDILCPCSRLEQGSDFCFFETGDAAPDFGY